MDFGTRNWDDHMRTAFHLYVYARVARSNVIWINADYSSKCEYLQSYVLMSQVSERLLTEFTRVGACIVWLLMWICTWFFLKNLLSHNSQPKGLKSSCVFMCTLRHALVLKLKSEKYFQILTEFSFYISLSNYRLLHCGHTKFLSIECVSKCSLRLFLVMNFPPHWSHT